ncbi:hypothetical protein NB311A_14742 [Nitrobacter sp. Nb-311A]|uniref:DUF2076 domain-containing protein n=1 Tax=unclassified Nitrobacter TaxID=2620411 RepID=UPI00006860A7|nr:MULTISPECIES: DUF2076 domain-containing protein [unclassified Nitrobacter]EAQ36534.1 hypothetical protein NB311A_14742 [Nitrobacter sp. Nb-311A]MCB1392728.1 DUF2076 domain-containing protein [Nitrobacter sp.]MCV0385602.1 DUF2076 domain-containing protein [Nitrobacter sp.]
MTPEERQLVDDLFTRLAGVENTPHDPAAAAAIAEGLRRAPNALYTLVQTVLVQDEALRRAHDRIQQLEAGGADGQAASAGGFLGQMRDTIFGTPAPRGSVPNVPPAPSGRPVWNTGEALQQTGQAGRSDRGPGSSPYGTLPPQAGGGSFLGTAAAAAVGAVGGGLLLSSIRSMMGGGEAHASSFGDSGSLGSSPKPGGAGDQSASNLAREAGVNDIGSQQHDDPSHGGSFDQDEDDIDSDDFDDFADFDDDDDNYA